MPAFLLEIACYLAPGFPALRVRFDALGPTKLRAALLTASGVFPYLIAALDGRVFHWVRFLELLAFILVAAFWYVWIPRSLFADFLFLAYMAAVYLARPFDGIYGPLTRHVSLGILGQLMWIHLGLMAVLSLRSLDDAHLGFLPTRAEWSIGARHFLFFLPVGGVLAYIEQLGRFHFHPHEWLDFAVTLVLTFFGIFWVVSLAEEFFFRAFLQRILARAAHSEIAGLLAASILFGLAHLPFRRFPNWRFALLTAALGFFCGLSFLRARSVRASMVTHALVATTWRMLFLS